MLRVCGVLLAVLLAGGSGLSGAQAPVQPATAQALKAVLFYKLPLFVYRTGETLQSRVTLCTLGRTQLEDALPALTAVPSEGLPVDVRMLNAHEDARGCDFVFVGRSESSRMAEVLAALAQRGVVTVSDIPGFARAGGMVELGLRRQGAGLAILINRGAARASGVEFRAQLLRLAEVVDD